MNALVSVSAKGTKTVLKAVRDNFAGVVKDAGVTVGSTSLVLTVNGEYAVKLADDSATGEAVYLNFGKPVFTANDPFVAKVAKPKAEKPAPVATELPALEL